MLEDSVVKTGSFHIDRGVGVRALSGTATGFAYSQDIDADALKKAIAAARSVGRTGEAVSAAVSTAAASPVATQRLYEPLDPLSQLEPAHKVAILEAVDAEARRQDPRIREVVVRLSGTYQIILVASEDGAINADVRPLVRLDVSVIAEDGTRREQGFAGGGGRQEYALFLENDKQLALEYAREAARLALVNLQASPAPAGVMPVVLGPGWPGVLLHEAIGHGLEGDFNRKGSSTFSGRLGERVATPLCTVVDDGTLPQRRGSLNVDDEGTPTQCNVLIEEGVLRMYMQDKLNARLMGVAPTGNGRRESYAYVPMPRMTNTYMLPGQHTHDEIIASVDRGLYAVNFEGGQVDITSGKFVFSMSEAYLIENGKITRPVKGAMLIGHGPEVLTKVSMVGNDLGLDRGVGICGKAGQSVPVGVGQPTLKVDELTVGGTAD